MCQMVMQQREKSWFACSPKSRLQYMAPTPRNPASEPPSQVPSLDPSIGPVATFCLLVLDPDQVQKFSSLSISFLISLKLITLMSCLQVDYLNLTSNERLIFATSGLRIDGEKLWTAERVNP